MQLATTAKNTSDNVTGSLSYINDLVTGATEEGLYKIFVGQQFLNDSMVADLIDNYGYDVYQRNVTMGTNQEYIVSWIPEATPVATHIPSPTPTPTPSPTASSTPTPTPTTTPTPTPTPDLVTTGLVIQLDANSNSSYPGT
jgi:cell division septation protein DedD